VPKTDVPGIYLRELGAGRVVYFPWDIDRTFWEVLAVDHFKLLRNAVEWATNGDPLITVSGLGMLDVTVWRQSRSITVHLVNLTNPMLMKGPVRDLIPVGEQRLQVRLPSGAKPKKMRLLALDRNVSGKYHSGCLSLTVPSILDHEVVAIDL
jgi:hypothetical protein